MRARIIVICVVVLAICLWVMLRRASDQAKTGTRGTELLQETPATRGVQEISAVSNHAPRHTEPAEAAEATSRSGGSPMSAPLAVPRQTHLSSNEVYQLVLAEWQAPIDFYGKVVDENSNAVAAASVRFQWIEMPTEDGEKTSTTESDAEGLFSLRGQRGASLEVSVSKEGYYSPRPGFRSFKYAVSAHFSPDPRNPVVFQLKKKGIPAELVLVKRNYRVSRNGTPLAINLATGNTATGGDANLVVQCWTDDRGKRSGEKYDWRCRVTIPGGGLVPTEDEFPFLAPESGYVPTTEIVMPADRGNWRSDVSLKFFYRLADGRYGRMTFSMIAGGDHFCMIESFLNPSGSQNLEPMN